MSLSNKGKPQIELYLFSKNQEFPVGQGHQTFIKRHSEPVFDSSNDLVLNEQISSNTFKAKAKSRNRAYWPGQWIHNQWIENHTKVIGIGVASVENPLTQLSLREESFGGIIFDSMNDRVYKVNKEGYKLMQEIIKKAKSKKLKSFKSSKFKEKDVNEFINFLKGAALWMT